VVVGSREKAPALARLLRGLGMRILRAPDAPSPSRIWLSWLLAPRRRHTFAFVRDALRASAREQAPAAPVAPGLGAYCALLALPASTLAREDVECAVRSADAIRASTAWAAHAERRALALGAPVASQELGDAFQRDLESDLAGVVLEGGLPVVWVPAGPTGDAVRTLVREERLRRFEGLVGDLDRRKRVARDLSEADEWRAWSDARGACEELLQDGGDANTVFEVAFSALTNYAARLTNVRSRRTLAGDVFRLAGDLADRARAPHAQALSERNVAAVRADRLPWEAEVEGDPICDRQRTLRIRDRLLRLAGGPLLLVAMVGAFYSAAAGSWVLLPVWVAAGALGSVLIALRAHLVECWMTPDGLVVQSLKGRFVAQMDDLRAVTAGPGPFLRFRLRRAPHWLTRRLATVATTPADARADADGIRAAMPQPEPGPLTATLETS
jgi:hypothetical protein